jgi:predicted dehydrogenase
MLRLMIAGLGSIGRRHLDNLRSLGVDDFVLYRQRPEPLPQASELPVFNDLDKALATRPDLVIVATPTAYHLTVALPAARRGLK